MSSENRLRIAFFADTYLEVNGAAMTCQRLVAYAKKKENPFLCIYADKETALEKDGSVTYLKLKRSPISFPLDEELAYDPLFQRHTNRVLRELVDFKPDVIHITGLNDVSIIGSYLAWKLQIPLLGSWHTNLHEFAAVRLQKTLRFLPKPALKKVTGFAEQKILSGAVLYYKMPKVVLAPNQELVNALGKGTHRVSRIMGRGVDTEKFSPNHRTVSEDGIFRIGFVGRLRPEKNVRLLVEIEQGLLNAGKSNFEFLIIGEGSEREFLEKNLKHKRLTGFLSGADLSEAYANMDVFVFPSETDAFGNVAQEAFASGVPSIVTDRGGPKYLVNEGVTGFIARNAGEFTSRIIELFDNRERLSSMKKNARLSALSKSWDSVFESVFDAYQTAFDLRDRRFEKNI